MPAGRRAGEPLAVLTRKGEVHEFETDSLADEVTGFGGGENEDPVAAFARFARRHGLLGKRVGLEVPAYYLHPRSLSRLKQLLGASLADATELIADLKLVKSPAELAYIRKAAALADLGMAALYARSGGRQSELALAGGVYETLLARQRHCREPDQSGVGAALRLQPRRADRARPAAGRLRQHRVRRDLPSLHRDDRPAVRARRADGAHARDSTTWCAGPRTP